MPPSGSWDSPGKNTRVGCYAHLQEELPDPEIKPAYLTSLALPGELFTTSATWEALIGQFHPKSPWRWPAIPRSLFMVSHLSLVRSGSVHSWGPGKQLASRWTFLMSINCLWSTCQRSSEPLEISGSPGRSPAVPPRNLLEVSLAKHPLSMELMVCFLFLLPSPCKQVCISCIGQGEKYKGWRDMPSKSLI